MAAVALSTAICSQFAASSTLCRWPFHNFHTARSVQKVSITAQKAQIFFHPIVVVHACTCAHATMTMHSSSRSNSKFISCGGRSPSGSCTNKDIDHPCRRGPLGCGRKCFLRRGRSWAISCGPHVGYQEFIIARALCLFQHYRGGEESQALRPTRPFLNRPAARSTSCFGG